MNQKPDHTLTIVLVLLQSAITVAFGIIGLKVSDVNLGFYTAISFIGICGMLTLITVMLFNRLNQLEVNFFSKLDHGIVNTKGAKASLLRKINADSKQIVVFGDEELISFLSSKGVRGTKVEATIAFESQTLAQKHAAHEQLKFVPEKFPIHAIFSFPISSGTSPLSAILMVPGNIGDSDEWIIIKSENFCEKIYRSFTNARNELEVFREETIDKTWLLEWMIQTHQRFFREWNALSNLRIEVDTPDAIYHEQRKLSTEAEWIHAFDMTEIDEWEDDDNLGACLVENSNSVKALGEELGASQIRRIFFAPSRAELERSSVYREKLARVILRHMQGGIGCGLVYAEDIRRINPAYIRDSVVYDKKVIWVETLPTTRFHGGGYFSTSKAEVNEFIKIFDEVWSSISAGRSPSQEANRFLKAEQERGNQ